MISAIPQVKSPVAVQAAGEGLATPSGVQGPTIVELHHGDCVHGMKSMAAESVDVVVTSRAQWADLRRDEGFDPNQIAGRLVGHSLFYQRLKNGIQRYKEQCSKVAVVRQIKTMSDQKYPELLVAAVEDMIADTGEGPKGGTFAEMEVAREIADRLVAIRHANRHQSHYWRRRWAKMDPLHFHDLAFGTLQESMLIGMKDIPSKDKLDDLALRLYLTEERELGQKEMETVKALRETIRLIAAAKNPSPSARGGRRKSRLSSRIQPSIK